MAFLFLRKDLEGLRQYREEIFQKYQAAAAAAGEACKQGGETTHDNFPFEQAKREMEMYGALVKEQDDLLNHAQIITRMSCIRPPIKAFPIGLAYETL